jgi:hypothetical protein
MVKDRRNPKRRDRDPYRQTCAMTIRLLEDERELLGILANRKGCSMAEYLRHMFRIGAQSAAIVITAKQAAARREAREAEEARQVEERERRELEEYLATPEGQAALAEAKRQEQVAMLQAVRAMIRQNLERDELARSLGWRPKDDEFP